MTIVDSNIPMYLVGAAHPNKDDARRAVERAIMAGERLVTDAEVLQEILHRYVAIDRRDAIQPALDALLAIVDEVLPVDASVVDRAKRLVLTAERLPTRDAIHIAVMQKHGIGRILSFDRRFDGIPGVVRVGE